MVRRARIKQSGDILDYLTSYGSAFEFYIVVYSVESIENGIYYYDVEAHNLVLISEGDFREEISGNINDQKAPLTASFTMFFVANVSQYQWRYRHERGLRNIYIESGRLSQHLLVKGLYLNMGSLVTPAIKDIEMNKLLKLDGHERFPLYTLTMGVISGD